MVNARLTTSEKIMIWMITVLLILSCFIFIYPIWSTIIKSVNESNAADNLGFIIWPSKFTTDAYKYLFTSADQLWIGYKNTIINTTLITVGHLLVCYLGAYGMSRQNMPFKGILQTFIIIPMFFGGGLIPQYVLIKNLGLMNTRWALIIPGLGGVWDTIILRNFMRSLPRELEESAEIDGASPLRTIFQILLPLSKPSLAVVALWCIVGNWNSYFNAKIYINDRSLKILGQVVREMTIDETAAKGYQLAYGAQGLVAENVQAATIMISIIPILCFYPFIQRYFTKGIMIGSLKG